MVRIWSEILRAEAKLLRTISNHYRPELHYMRGPGPKWEASREHVAKRKPLPLVLDDQNF